MSDDNPSRSDTSPQDSPSASPSPTPSATPDASSPRDRTMREQTLWIKAVNSNLESLGKQSNRQDTRLADIERRLETYEAQGRFREQTCQNAVNLSTAAIERSEKTQTRLADRVDRVIALTREVRRDERQTRAAQDEFGRVEITRKGVRISAAWVHIKSIPFAVKILLGLLGAAGGVIAYLAQRIAHH